MVTKHSNKYYFIYIVFFIIFNFVHVTNGQLEASQLSCLNNLVSYVGDSRYMVPNIGDIFCTSYERSNCTGNKVNSIEIIQSNNNMLNWSYLSCFDKLNVFIGFNLIIDQTFISSAPSNVKRLDIFSTLTSIEVVVPPFDYLRIVGLKGPIKSSHINNVIELDILANIESPNYLEMDQQMISGNIQKLSISINSAPNLSLLPNLKEVRLNILKTIDTNTFSNFISFGSLNSITFTNNDANALIPFLYSLNDITKPAFTKLEFIDIRFQELSKFIDFSNIVNEASIMFSGAGPKFHFNGLFPISKFPNSRINNFSFIKTSLANSSPDFNAFKNVSNVVITGFGIKGSLPPINPEIDFTTIDLSNNGITNDIDPSWCGIPLNVQNNDIISIPACFRCYFNNYDTRVNSYFSGNINLKDQTYSCGNDFLQPKFEIKSNQLIITGSNIGYYADNIESSPSLTFIKEAKNRFIADISSITPNTFISIHWKIPGIFFNYRISDSGPKITSISQTGNEITIVGLYFSYYIPEVSVTIKNTICSVFESAFDIIKCRLPNPVKMDGDVKAIVNISGKQDTISFNIVNTACSTLCGNGKCDYELKECICDKKYRTIGDNICTIINHYLISYTQISSVEGGSILLYGWFNISGDLSIKIDTQECVPESGNDQYISCHYPGGSIGQKQINITQNGLAWLGKIYPYYDSVVLCYNNCTSPKNGKCSNGQCICEPGFKGLDCSGKNDTTIDIPKTETNITSDGDITLSNGNSDFKISIYSINELNLSNQIVQSFPVSSKWSIYKEKQNGVTSFIQVLNNATIILYIEEISSEKDKEFQFAGNNFTVEAGGVKVSLEINYWEYKSVLNTIQLVMIADYQENLIKESNDCNQDNLQINTTSNSKSIKESVNYLTIENKGKILFGRFQDKAISNEHNVFITTQIINQTNESSDKNYIYIGLNLPHGERIIIDPDFSVIVGPNFISKCGSGRNKWFLPVVVVVPIVGLALLIIISAIIYKKSTTLKIALNEIKLRSFN